MWVRRRRVRCRRCAVGPRALDDALRPRKPSPHPFLAHPELRETRQLLDRGGQLTPSLDRSASADHPETVHMNRLREVDLFFALNFEFFVSDRHQLIDGRRLEITKANVGKCHYAVKWRQDPTQLPSCSDVTPPTLRDVIGDEAGHLNRPGRRRGLTRHFAGPQAQLERVADLTASDKQVEPMVATIEDQRVLDRLRQVVQLFGRSFSCSAGMPLVDAFRSGPSGIALSTAARTEFSRWATGALAGRRNRSNSPMRRAR